MRDQGLGISPPFFFAAMVGSAAGCVHERSDEVHGPDDALIGGVEATGGELDAVGSLRKDLGFSGVSSLYAEAACAGCASR